MRFWLYLFLLLITKSLYGGTIPYRFTHLSTREGLPHNYVHSVAQDKKGFIWIGTNNGLARYDGYNFKVFQPDPSKPTGISKKPANRVYADLRGNLWVSFLGMGVNKMNLETEQFVFFSADTSSNHTISGNWVKKFFESKDSTLWMVSNKGLDVYNPITKCIDHPLPNKIQSKTIPSNNILDCAEDYHNNIWFLSTRGIGRLNRKTSEVASLGSITAQPGIDSEPITAMHIDQNQTLWFSTKSKGLYRYDIRQNRLTVFLEAVVNLQSFFLDKAGNVYAYADNPTYKLFYAKSNDVDKRGFTSYSVYNIPNSNNTVKFAEDGSGNVWLTSYQGLEMFNSRTGLTDYRTNIYIPNTLFNNNIDFIFIDNQDNLWASVFRQGICKADLKQKPFRWFLSDPSAPKNSLTSNNVTAIYEDSKQNIWVGCFNKGIILYNPNNDTYTSIASPDVTKLNNNVVSAFFEDNQGYMWVGYYDDEVSRINTRTLKLESFSPAVPKNDSHYFNGNGVRKIAADRSGNLWFASSGGLIERNQKTGEFTKHTVLYEKNYSASSFYRTVYIDQNDIIWAGSNNGGLARYDKTHRQFHHYLNNPENPKSISSNTVYAIFEDKEGCLWVGTGLGLNRFDRKTGQFTSFGVNTGLNRLGIYSINPDKSGNLWMSSDNGLIKYSIKTSKWTLFDETDGLLGNEFNTTSSYLSKSGKLYLGSPGGMISFQPTDITKNPFGARPIITNIQIFNKSISPGDSLHQRIVLQKQIWATQEIELYYTENDFILEFSALHYAAPEKIQYFYKLEGFSKDWVATPAKRHWAVFTGLPPGNYTFRLKATNNDGVMCNPKDEVILKIVILPPFWRTLWFRLTFMLLLIGIAGAYIRYRIFFFKNQNELLEQKVKIRTSELEEANSELEEQQEEISLQKEEIESQNETLAETNKALAAQKQQILEQNIELDKHHEVLELLVEERTHELEKALFKAEESDRLKSSFLSNMSHEIRTPMNAIIGFSSLLRDKNISETEKDDFIKIILSSGESLLVLINDILDLSKIQVDQMTLSMASYNLPEIMRELLKSFEQDTALKGLSLRLNINNLPADFTITTDKVRFKQVYGNLLANAIKFTANGSIEFGVSKFSNSITFYIQDTGEGIPDSAGNSIFDRFLKLENNKNKLFGGTGLGLAICKNLVELWGGKIWYQSICDQGTIFYFTHPLSKDEKEKITAPKPTVDYLDLEGKTILIAEDEKNNYKLLLAYLSKTKANVAWAQNGREAIDYVIHNPVDLILMDIKMPVMGGIEATIAIKQTHPQVIVVAQTAFAYKAEIAEFLQAGVDGYLIKPIKMNDLMGILKQYF
jgi:signal transduction histidine kinase/ligand-binding sensor domain-containing protein/CheY-like chemotaxis protein